MQQYLTDVYHRVRNAEKPEITLWILTLIGSALRIFRIDAKSLWFAEGEVYWMSQGTLLEAIRQNAVGSADPLTNANSAPPLFVILLNLITRIGNGEVMIKLVPLLAGCAAIPVTYYLARRFVSRWAALFSAFLVMLSTTQIQYSQHLREYTLTYLLATLMLLFYHKFLKERQWKAWAGFVCVTSVGLFTQYGLALFLAALNVAYGIELLKNRESRSGLLKWIGAQCIFGLVTVGVVFVALKDQMSPGFGHVYMPWAYWDGTLGGFAQLMVNGTYDILEFADPGKFIGFYTMFRLNSISLFIFVFLAGIAAMVFNKKDYTALTLLMVPTVLCFILAVMKLYPYHGDRHDIFLLPMIYLTGGFAFEYLLQHDVKKIVTTTMVVFIGWTGIYSSYEYLLKYPGFHHIKPVAQALEQAVQPEDRVYIFYGALPPFLYHYKGNHDQLIYGIRSRFDPQGHIPQLEEINREPGRVWIVMMFPFEGEKEAVLEYFNQHRELNLFATGYKSWLYTADERTETQQPPEDPETSPRAVTGRE